LKKDEALGLITLYMEPHLVHHTNNKSAKQVCDAFHILFGVVNTTQINRLEAQLSNLKMVDFATVEEYISWVQESKRKHSYKQW
jgi:hypothetical protein